MEAGQRYYVITDLRTNEMVVDLLDETERFETAEDAREFINELICYEEGTFADYRIDCLRW